MIRTVDLSTDVAGRFAAKLFAMDGADVARPAFAEVGDTLSLYLDHGKRPVSAGDGLEALLDAADLVFTTWPQGALNGLANSLSELPPKCVQVVTSSFGASGPYASCRGGPMAEWAAGGYLGITGDPQREPLIGPEHLCAYVTGYAAAAAAEAALRQARWTGGGARIDISVMGTMLSLHQSTFSRLAAGCIRRRTGRFAEVYPLTVRPCVDGYVSLGVVLDDEFDRLAIAFGMPELSADPRFASREARMANAEALDAELDRYLRDRTAEEVVANLQAQAVAAAEVVDPGEVLANPQLRHRNYWTKAAGLTMPGSPLRAPIDFAGDGQAVQSTAAGPLPLSGITVLDFTAYWAGPSATRLLADLGATVIWVERARSRVDFDPKRDDPQAVQLFLYHQKMNRHKRSVVLDLGSPAGRETARALAARADVVVENFRPGAARRLGLGPEHLCARDPRLVYVSLSGYGSDGPWGEWRSFGPNLEAASSMLARTGYPGGEPMRLGHALPDGVGGLAGALAALRGLRRRDETGRGGWFDVSQLEVYAAISGEDIAAASGGTPIRRIGNRSRHEEMVQGVFPCAGDDQWIALRLSTPGDVAAFCRMSGVDINDPTEAEKAIGHYTASRDKTVLFSQLQNAGIEAFPVLLAHEFVTDPHLLDRGFFLTVECGERRYQLPGLPFRCEPPITDVNGRAPLIGEHTAAVLADLASTPSGATAKTAVSARH